MTYQFKIQLKNISKPPVWRRLQVAGDTDLHSFHEIIQEAFGWENYHMYQFSANGYGSDQFYTPNSEEERYFDSEYSSSDFEIKDLFLKEGQKMIYIYDFGDDWMHKIVLEEISESQLPHPTLMAGKGACPPEDCGGPWGYGQLKEDKKVDPHNFDLKVTAERLKAF